MADILQIIWEGGSLIVLGLIVFAVCLPAVTPVDNRPKYTYCYDKQSFKHRKSHACKDGFHLREWDEKRNRWC